MSYLNEPQILEQTYQGLIPHSIADEMFRRREIICADEISAETVNSLVSQILELSHENPSGEIIFYINSPGGEVSSGLALYDVMQAVPNPVHTVCVGTAASMAAVIFAAGDKRSMLPHSAVMIHDPSIERIGGSALDVMSRSEDLMRTRGTLCSILAEHTGKTIDEICDKTKQDTYFYAEEAVEFGLADNIIHSIKEVYSDEK